MTAFFRSTALRIVSLVLAIGAVALIAVLLPRIGFLFRTETEVYSTGFMKTNYRWGSPVRGDVTNLENSATSFWIEYTKPKLPAALYCIVGAEVPIRFMNTATWCYFDTNLDSRADVRVRSSSRYFQRIEIFDDCNAFWITPTEDSFDSLLSWVDWVMYDKYWGPFFDFRAAEKELFFLIDSAIEDADSVETQQILAQYNDYLKGVKRVSGSRKELKWLERLSSDLEKSLKADAAGE